jgi:hypothetical protein
LLSATTLAANCATSSWRCPERSCFLSHAIKLRCDRYIRWSAIRFTSAHALACALPGSAVGYRPYPPRFLERSSARWYGAYLFVAHRGRECSSAPLPSRLWAVASLSFKWSFGLRPAAPHRTIGLTSALKLWAADHCSLSPVRLQEFFRLAGASPASNSPVRTSCVDNLRQVSRPI